MKQTAKNSVRSMLSYPFTLHSHTYFFFWCYHFLMLPLCLAGFDYTIHQGPYTKVHTPSYFRGFKCPYTCLFLYRKKLQMSTFLVYLYKKKPLRASRGPYTSVHQILCSNSMLKLCAQTLCYLCYHSHHPSSLALYFLSIFHWLILSLGHSVLWGIICRAQRTVSLYLSRTAHWFYIISRAQRTVPLYLSRTAHCSILSLAHSVLFYIISYAYRSVLLYLLFIYSK